MALARLYPIATDDLMPQIEAFVECLKMIEGVEQIILFGSMAREEMTAASDIDLAIIFSTRENVTRYKAKVREIKNQTISWPCDLFICDRHWFNQRRVLGGICMSIDHQGKPLYTHLDSRDQHGTQR